MYAAAGRRSEALRLLEVLQVRDSTRGYVDPFRMASLAAATCSSPADDARIFTWLERALDDHSSNLCFIRLNRVFRRFDADPRVSSLMQRLAFPI